MVNLLKLTAEAKPGICMHDFYMPECYRIFDTEMFWGLFLWIFIFFL